MSGPLGTVPGMTFDPERNRYFPTPKDAPATEADTRPTPGPSSRGRAAAAPLTQRAGLRGTLGLGNRPGSSHTASPSPGPLSRAMSASSREASSGSVDQRPSTTPAPRTSRQPFMQPQMRHLEDLAVPPPACMAGFPSTSGFGMKRERSSDGTAGFDYGLRSCNRLGRVRSGRFGLRYATSGLNDLHLGKQERILSDLQHEATHQVCGCHGEVITSYKTFGEEAYCATTDHGKLIMHMRSGNTAVFSVCSERLSGVHHDIPRLIVIAISGGREPHLHLFKRDPEVLNHVFMTHSELPLQNSDVFGTSSFDDMCTVGGAKSLTTISYTSHLHATKRRLPSDALTVHQVSRDLIFAGQRSGHVALEDLRIQPVHASGQNIVASTTKGKAVVGVKRLDDAAVPWGLIMSGLSHEMQLFDIRYGNKPLWYFNGHFNTFHTSVGLATSPNDKHLFASGSDNRVRGWNILTGDQLVPSLPPHEDKTLRAREEEEESFLEHGEANPLWRTFNHRISALTVREDLGLDVVERGDLLRFGRK
ncbi:hypothetical protein IAU60_000037 [Kwoniella sp. DSM 27419]